MVEVPINVKVPPKIAAYDNGSRTLVGLMWNFWHKLIARGIKIATAAVLLIKPEIKDVVIKNIVKVNHFLLPPTLYSWSARTSKKPVFTRELLIIKIAPMVITALLLNPLTASSIVIILLLLTLLGN